MQRASIPLIRLLAKCEMSVKQLKSIFQLLHVQKRSVAVAADRERMAMVRPGYAPTLSSALENTLREEFSTKAPSNFFYFEGFRSGMRMSPMPRWTGFQGYTFMTWIRCEETPRLSGIP